MIVNDKNEGTKITYEISGKFIFLGGDLGINLHNYQKDDDVFIDICMDEIGNLVVGAKTGYSYVAQIYIPKKEYDHEMGAYNELTKQYAITKVLKPFDIEKVELTLWSIDHTLYRGE